jgi:DNA polymerase III delta subunit
MIIFHGEDRIASREAYLDAKQKLQKSHAAINSQDGSKLTISVLLDSLNSVSLLSEKSAVFIDDFFARRAGNEKKEIVKYLIENPNQEIYIWESKDQSLQLKSFPVQVVKVFDLPKYVFQYLENFSQPLLQKTLVSTPPEQLMALLAGHIQKLILAKESALNLPPWQLSRLTSQAAKYSLDRLRTMNYELLAIDYNLKNSNLPYDLAAALEFWTVSQN